VFDLKNALAMLEDYLRDCPGTLLVCVLAFSVFRTDTINNLSYTSRNGGKPCIGSCEFIYSSRPFFGDLISDKNGRDAVATRHCTITFSST